jgi:uncharacterized protein
MRSMKTKMSPVIHFEMPARDSRRVSEFYQNVFGWQTTSLGKDAGDFVMAFTMESDEKTRIPRRPGAINGGFYKRTKEDEKIRLTILVDDIREAMEKVRKNGGKVLGEPMEMPGVGLFVSFSDTEGNVCTLNQDYTVKTL